MKLLLGLGSNSVSGSLYHIAGWFADRIVFWHPCLEILRVKARALKLLMAHRGLRTLKRLSYSTEIGAVKRTDNLNIGQVF